MKSKFTEQKLGNEIKKNLPYSKTVLYLFALAFFSGVLTVLIGTAVLPIGAALLSTLLFFEKRAYKPLTVAVILVTVTLDTVLAVLAGTYVPTASLTLVCSVLVMFFCYRAGCSKGESAFYLTSVLVLLLGAGLVLDLFSEIGEYSLEALSAYVEETYIALREEFVSTFSELTVTLSDGSVQSLISADDAANVFDGVASVSFAFAVIFCFAIAGIALMLYRTLLLRLSAEEEKVLRWRFSVTKPVAIFYLVVMLLSFFTGLDGEIFSVTLYNLYYIFMFVHAYIGLRFLFNLEAVRRRPFIIFLALSSIVMFTSAALALFSVMGAFLTFSQENKETV